MFAVTGMIAMIADQNSENLLGRPDDVELIARGEKCVASGPEIRSFVSRTDRDYPNLRI